MPQYDIYHEVVKQALIKDGWKITHDPFTIQFRDIYLYADLGAERIIGAEKQGHKIVVEIKTFSGLSLMTELEKAVGQYGIYRTLLNQVDPERKLYLAITQEIYRDFFQRPALQVIVADHQIKLIVFKPETEEIVQWIS